YANIIDKLIGNDSDKLSSLFSKIKSRLTNSISSATLSRDDYFLVMPPSSSSIQKTPVPKQLSGIPYHFTYGYKEVVSSRVYRSDYETSALIIHMEYNDNVTILFHKSGDDAPIYLDIDIYAKFRNNETKSIYLQYIDDTQNRIIYQYTGAR
uniref:DUF685 domain-containing protein n=2 Tax=Borreliella afzelii TaxID=29518 RepID=UPI00359C1A15